MSPSSCSRALGPEFSQGWGAGPGSPWRTGGQRGGGRGWKGGVESQREGVGKRSEASAPGVPSGGKLRPDRSCCGAASCICLPQGGRGMVAELAAAELPGGQGKGKPDRRPSSPRAPHRSVPLGAAPPALGDEKDSPCFSPRSGSGKTDPDLDPWDTSPREGTTFKGRGAPRVGIHRKEKCTTS